MRLLLLLSLVLATSAADSLCAVTTYNTFDYLNDPCKITFAYRRISPPTWINHTDIKTSLRKAQDDQLDELSQSMCACGLVRIHRLCSNELFDIVQSLLWGCFPDAYEAVKRGIDNRAERLQTRMLQEQDIAVELADLERRDNVTKPKYGGKDGQNELIDDLGIQLRNDSKVEQNSTETPTEETDIDSKEDEILNEQDHNRDEIIEYGNEPDGKKENENPDEKESGETGSGEENESNLEVLETTIEMEVSEDEEIQLNGELIDGSGDNDSIKEGSGEIMEEYSMSTKYSEK